MAPVGSTMMLSQPMPATSRTSFITFAPRSRAFLVAALMSGTSTLEGPGFSHVRGVELDVYEGVWHYTVLLAGGCGVAGFVTEMTGDKIACPTRGVTQECVRHKAHYRRWK